MKQESISQDAVGLSRFDFNFERRVAFTDTYGSFAEVYPYINKLMMNNLPLNRSRTFRC